MRPLDAADMLALWERGAARHALDRALLLVRWARAGAAAGRARRPAARARATRALLRLRRRCFGARIERARRLPAVRRAARARAADADALLAAAAGADAGGESTSAGCALRAADHARPRGGRRRARRASARRALLLERCCVDAARPRCRGRCTGAVAAREVEDGARSARSERRPRARRCSCDACGAPWQAQLDVGALLWDEIDARAAALLDEVHVLASRLRLDRARDPRAERRAPRGLPRDGARHERASCIGSPRAGLGIAVPAASDRGRRRIGAPAASRSPSNAALDEPARPVTRRRSRPRATAR